MTPRERQKEDLRAAMKNAIVRVYSTEQDTPESTYDWRAQEAEDHAS